MHVGTVSHPSCASCWRVWPKLAVGFVNTAGGVPDSGSRWQVVMAMTAAVQVHVQLRHTYSSGTRTARAHVQLRHTYRQDAAGREGAPERRVGGAALCSPSPTAFSAYVFSQFPTAVSAAVVMNTRVTTIAVVATSRFWISAWVAWVQTHRNRQRLSLRE